ncbi:formate dehydrogenase subunit gamma [Sedimenticola selenatireducens]|uniref:Formate dehydrogenase subunit gamma n=1 Tax=Sedimenticola selenatireducens TaxID=191960 RepID=A0A558DXB6_9GAMM|nr:formate dehydrogenase subunit gamma [Sedimenticola selenatireducens]TVO70730.1 formate dehydrogenase subunit gamma [Sedimenticola selenatireducens]TVT65650.1 MAG: formate dehydrogenase subunit gamma [Sedimenticola selenatireducens]
MRRALIPHKGYGIGDDWVFYLLILIMLSPLLVMSTASAESGKNTQPIQIPNPSADLWREVRQRDAIAVGNSQVKSADSGVLINPYGDKWRNFRMTQLIPYGGYLLAGMLLLLIIFFIVRGRIKVVSGMSDKKLFRYSLYERTIHWCLAAIFLFLAFTGLILLFGRSLLIPIVGQEFFSLLASASKEGHNLFGPLFAVALVLVFFRFVRRNIYQKGDLTWLLKGGGLIGKGHVPSNFFNMGEKSMFWMLVLVGGVIVGSGLVLVFPVFGQGRVLMELSHVSHGITTLVMIVVIMGHIYIGSVGMEGALDGMTTGYCDLNWAKEHHEQWAELCEEQNEVIMEDEVSRLQGDTKANSMPSSLTQETGQ